MLPERAAGALAEYVAAGGALVAEARLGWNNERGNAAERIPGLGMSEVMGARETAIETAPSGRASMKWSGTDLPGLPAGTLLPGRWFKETLEPVGPAARVVARYEEDGAAAAVMSTHGKGRTLMLGSYISAAAQSTPTREAEGFFSALVAWAGVVLPIRVTGSPLEARHVESGAERVLFLFNHGEQQARSEVTLRVGPGDYVAEDLAGRGAIVLTRAADHVRLAAEVPPGRVQVIRIRPRQP